MNLLHVMEKVCAMCFLCSYGSTHCYYFHSRNESLLHRPAQILLTGKAKNSKDLWRLRSHFSSNVCMVTCCSSAGIKSSFGSPGTQKHPQGQGRHSRSKGEGNVLVFFPFLWKFGRGVLLVLVFFFLVVQTILCYCRQPAQQGGWLRELCRN